MRTERVRRRAALVLAVAAVVLLPACGTRLSDQEAVDQLRSAQGAGGGSVSQGGGGDVALDGGTGLGPDGLGGGVDGPTGGTVSAPDAGGGTGGGGSDGGGGPAAASGTDTAAGGGTAGGGTAGGTSGGRTGGGGSRGGGGGGPKAPIVLGMVGNFSGIIGASLAATRDAVAAWVATVNKRGGIDGHQVKLLIADTGGNASNDLVFVRRLVEQEGAIALINFHPSSSGDGVGEYAQKKGIAIVGGSGLQPAWNKWLTMFPHTTSGKPQNASWAVPMKDAGLTKVGSVHCVESKVCAEKQADWAKAAKSMGLEVVYEGQVSLAQPDFTGACSQARSRGAESVVVILDGNSALRYARDCARQQYKHLIIIANPTSATSPAIEGAIGPVASFPWLLMSGSPALDEYGAAIKKYVDLDKTSTYTALGWTAGKLMEKALTGRVSDQPKPADVLEGMWAMKGETLGGLSQPLTFTKGKPAPVIPCAWKAVVQGGKWTAPAGTKPVYCP